MQNDVSTPDDNSLIRPLSDRFPATARWIYIDAASMGLLPVSARDHAIEVLDSQLVAGVNEDPWLTMGQSCRMRFAGLINVVAQDVSLWLSLAGALSEVAGRLQPRPGGNLVMSAALSRPAFVSFWRRFAQRHSLEMREVPLEHDGFAAGRVRELIDARTLMVVLPVVSYARGWRLPVAEIGSLCRELDVFFLADGTSSVGILHTDVARDGIDALVVAAEGNALGVSGLAFAYISASGERRVSTQRLSAPRSVAATFGDTMRAIHERLHHAEEPHLVSLVAAYEVLGVVDGCGVPRIESHALALAERLRSMLDELGLPVDRQRGDGPLSHVAVIGVPGAEPDGLLRDPDLRRFAEQLTAGRVRYAIRSGQLQFGFHLYNRLRDVMDVRRIAMQSLAG